MLVKKSVVVVVTLRVVRVRDDIKDVDFPVPSRVELELSWRLAVTARAAIMTMEVVMTVLTHVMLCHVRRDHATTLSETTAKRHSSVLNISQHKFISLPHMWTEQNSQLLLSEITNR